MLDPKDELRETARWVISITLQRGRLIADDEDVYEQLFGFDTNWSFYSKRLETTVARLVSEMSNYEFSFVDLVNNMRGIKRASEFIEAVEKTLRAKPSQIEERCAVKLPSKEFEPLDSVGAI